MGEGITMSSFADSGLCLDDVSSSARNNMQACMSKALDPLHRGQEAHIENSPRPKSQGPGHIGPKKSQGPEQIGPNKRTKVQGE